MFKQTDVFDLISGLLARNSTFSESKELEYQPITSSQVEINKALIYPNPTSGILFLDIDIRQIFVLLQVILTCTKSFK